MTVIRTLGLTLISTATCASAALASDISVSPGGSIQDAIDAALPGDRVLLQPGTYVELIDFGGKAIEVIGVRGAMQTILDGDGSGPVVRFANGEGPDSRLSGVTVTGGFAAFGAGGVNCNGSLRPTIEDCVIESNRGKFGGGVSGSPVLRRCQILNNTSSLTHGGGLIGAPQLSYCIVAGNTATSADGGGMYIQGISTLSVIDHCIIANNRAVFANSHGGGIYAEGSAHVQITNSVIVGNFSTGGVFQGRGGGVYVESGGSSMLHCTVVGNSVSGSSTLGAGIYGPLQVQDSIVRGNLGGPQISSASLVTYCDVEGGYVGTGNLDLDPLFVDAANSEFHLVAGSPVIDAGDPLLLDADGTRSDMGAFHYQSLFTAASVLENSWQQASWPEISLATGGQQGLEILAGNAQADLVYLVLGSASGTTPGFPVSGFVVPLAVDNYFLFTITAPNSEFLSSSLAFLDGMGRGRAEFAIPADFNPAFAGVGIDHAAVVLDLGVPTVTFVTNPLSVQLVP